MSTTFILDASSLQYRAYYVTEQRQTFTKEGVPNAAVFLFRTMLQKIKRDHNPSTLLAACDSKAPTFRTKLYPFYKANRQQPPAAYAAQRAGFLEVMIAESIPSFHVEGWEADDVIGTLAKQHAEIDDVVIVSGDKDMAQLVRTGRGVQGAVSVLNTNKDKIFGPLQVLEEYGVLPQHICDYLALVGDSSDNVPGAKGIGPKSAIELIKQFGTVEQMCERPGEISSGRLRHAVVIYKDWILLSKKLVTIDCNAPIHQMTFEG